MSSADDADWTVAVQPAPKFPVPNFIRLFVLVRVLHEVNDDAAIRKLVAVFQEKEEQETAFSILSNLINNGGIKEYMRRYYDERYHCIIIEKIFNQIILTKYSSQFQLITTFSFSKIDNNINFEKYKYQIKVFNTNDVMSLIFGYLTYSHNFDGDLLNCSLVCSYWLYHVYNPNSIYHIDISKLLKARLQGYKQEIAVAKGELNVNFYYNRIVSLHTRQWQRLINCKSIWIYMYPYHNNIELANNLLLSKILTLKNIEKIYCKIRKRYLSIFKAIIANCKDTIKQLNLSVGTYTPIATNNDNNDNNDRDNTDDIKTDKKQELDHDDPEYIPKILILPNVEKITIEIQNFDDMSLIGWSKKCHYLELKKINKFWCDFVINNCDCSGIKHLKFWNTVIVDDDDDEVILVPLLIKLANKFTGINKLSFEFSRLHKNFGILLQALKPIINKNNTEIHVDIPRDINVDINSYISFTENCTIGPTVLSCIVDSNTPSALCDMISNDYIVKRLEILDIEDADRSKKQVGLMQFINFLSMADIYSLVSNVSACNQLQCLKVIRIVKRLAVPIVNSQTLHDFLDLEWIVKRQLFIIVVFKIKMDFMHSDDVYCYNDEFFGQFSKLCQKIASLIIDKHLPIDITLLIKTKGHRNDTFKELNTIVQSVFSKIYSTRCQLHQDQCNAYCIPLAQPIVSLTVEQESFIKLCGKNVQSLLCAE